MNMNNVTEVSSGLNDTTSFTRLLTGTTFPEFHVAMFMWNVCAPCILLFGGFGTIATIFVMRRIKDHNSSQHAFLITLAASDFILLYTGALRHWVYFLFGVDLRSVHTLTCKLLIWLVYSSNTASAWLLTCVTVQRTLAVKWPHKIKLMCTLKRTWVVIIALVFSVCALHFPCLIVMDISTEGKCQYVSGRYINFALVWRWGDMCISSIVPAFCLLVCDVILSLTLFEATSSTSVSVNATSNTRTAQHISSRKKVASRTTVMILALSCTFLVLTLPVCVYLIWEHYASAYVNESPRLYAQATLAFTVTFLLWYSNSAANFLLYCFTGTRFRREFLRWMHCGAQDDSTASSGEKFG